MVIDKSLLKIFKTAFTYLVFPIGMFVFVGVYVRAAQTSGNPSDFENLPAIGLLTLVTIVTVVLLEWILPFKSVWNRYVLEDTNDLLHLIFSAMSADTLSRITLNIGITMIYSRLYSPLSWWPQSWPFWLQVGFGVFLYDFTYYWYHRLFHHLPFLWRIHRIHHCSEKLTFSKTFRFNFAEIFFENILLLGVLKLFSTPPNVLVWVMAMVNFTVLVKHANIDVRFPRFLDWVFVSPGNHRIHHSSDMVESNSNFSGFTMIWDVIFGTYRNGRDYQDTPLGVKGHVLSKNFWGQIFDFLNP